MKHLVLILAVAFGIQTLHGQRLEEFSNNRSEFIGQLHKYMTSGKHKTLEIVYSEFEQVFYGGTFTEEEESQILGLCNIMLKERMAASPYFRSYLKGLSLIKKEEDGAQKFQEWHQVLTDILTKSTSQKLKHFLDFADFSIELFEHKALQYSENSTSWHIIGGNYKMVFG